MKKSLIAFLLILGIQFAYALDAPDVQLEVSGEAYVLIWSEITGAAGYNIYGMNEPYGSGTLLAEVGPEVLSYDVSGLGEFFFVTSFDSEVIPGPAPDPTGHEEEDVISVFSNVFTDLPDTDFNPWWWQNTIVTIEDLVGNPTLKYANFNYQGTQLAAPQDLSLMEYLHLDLWTQNEAAVNVFLVSQTTGEQPYAMAPVMDVWNSYDIPLSHFSDLGLSLADIHQLKFDGGTGGTIYLDNIYFWKAPVTQDTDATLSDLLVDGTTVDGFDSEILNYDVELPQGTEVVPTVTAVTTVVGATHVVNAAPELPGTTDVVVTALDGITELTYSIDFTVAFVVPLVAAPTPTTDPDSVLSIYSDAYTNLADTNFNPFWGQSTQVTVDHDVAGDNTLLYEDLDFQGTNLGHADGADQDVSEYAYLHVDFWSPNTPVMHFYLISRTTGERGYAMPSTQEEWVSLDIPLSHYSDQGLNLTDIFQFKVHGGDGTVVMYFDNWYFHGYTEVVEDPEPTVAAPTPTEDPETVLSIYSDAYTDLADTNFNPSWGQTTIVTVDHDVAGDNTLLYENLNYQGTNLGHFDGADQDVSGYGYIHVDFWTPNATALDFYLISSTPQAEFPYSLPVTLEEWVSVDIPLSHYSGINLEAIYQFKVTGGNGSTVVYFDNWYFHGESVVEPDPEPTEPAPAPTYPAEDVISLFSDVYTNHPVDTWSAGWDQANVSDWMVDGDNVKLYENLVFAGIEFTTTTVDATAMTHFRLDFWTPDATDLPAFFKIKLVDFGADGAWGGGDDVEHELWIDASYATPLQSENWVVFDLPFTEFPGLTTRAHLAQLIISGDPNTVYIDNVLFHQ